MKVKELKSKLDRMDHELDVILYCEDEKFSDDQKMFVVFEALSVDSAEVTRCRLDDGTPYLKFETGRGAEKLALVEITSDT